MSCIPLSSVSVHAMRAVAFVWLVFLMSANIMAESAEETVNEYYKRAERYYDAGVKDRAMEEMKKGLDMAVRTGDKAGEAMMLNGIYKIYYYEGRVDEAEDLLGRSLAIYRSLKDTTNMINLYNNLALSAYSSGKSDKAISLFNNALELCGADGIKRATVLQNMSDIYVASDRIKTALKLLVEAACLYNSSPVSERKKTDNVRSHFLTLAKRAQVEIRMDRKTAAQSTLDSASLLVSGIERVRRPDALAHLSNIRLEIGDSIGAFRLMLGYEALMDSLTKENSASSLQSLLVQFDTERLQQRNEALRLKVQNRNIALASGITISVLLLVLSGFLVWKLKSDRRRSRIIQQQQRDIVRYQKEASDLREREMRHELDSQNRQLTSFAINHSAINEFHAGLVAEIARCREMITDGKQNEATKVMDECASRCRRFDEDVLSHDFRVYFEKVHPEFFSRLKSRFPLLTKNDLRLCAFLYLGMSTKEIAALTYREIRSVESSRLRLRKKLEISGDVSLQDFLIAISDEE